MLFKKVACNLLEGVVGKTWRGVSGLVTTRLSQTFSVRAEGSAVTATGLEELSAGAGLAVVTDVVAAPHGDAAFLLTSSRNFGAAMTGIVYPGWVPLTAYGDWYTVFEVVIAFRLREDGCTQLCCVIPWSRVDEVGDVDGCKPHSNAARGIDGTYLPTDGAGDMDVDTSGELSPGVTWRRFTVELGRLETATSRDNARAAGDRVRCSVAALSGCCRDVVLAAGAARATCDISLLRALVIRPTGGFGVACTGCWGCGETKVSGRGVTGEAIG
jgi:hypothetical protein